ncbi:hypothetical protein Syun_027178 [Stephania yunnanensis]|uniref:Uncharacterized protein n=1 Tax=Stephania yunnanensis TaxID=152371 RepID=A0AAP0EK87_9MAGN
MASFVAIFLLCSFFAAQLCNATDTITRNNLLRDGETLVSSGGNYALGFFSPGNSKQRYVGIWYNKVQEQTVVWVANRDNPVQNSSLGILKISERGNLAIYNASSTNPVWSTNASLPGSKYIKPTLIYMLLDTGNLVLCDEDNMADFLWQSFDYPTDTHLPGMNLKLGTSPSLRSWKSPDDPSTGDFSFEIFIKKGSQKIWRSGKWDGQGWNGDGSKGDGFLKLENMKRPDTSNARVDMSLGIKECEIQCRNNCSCTAYSSAYVDGSGCIAWFRDLNDVRDFPEWGQDLFVRVDVIELGTNEESSAMFELPFFDLDSMIIATENFSPANRLGTGGFGSVYKAWELWKDGKPLELVDPSMGTSFPEREVAKFIQVGILSVQEDANDRPTMSSIISMLGNEATMPSPKQPGFVLTSNVKYQNLSATRTGSGSVNEMSTTVVEGR